MSFSEDVRIGLSADQKFLSSKYFYDSVGDRIFQQIMKMPEYYLTRAEFEILRDQSLEILKTAFADFNDLDVIELGAGDGTKTKLLLKTALQSTKHTRYYPIDISANVLIQCSNFLHEHFPELEIVSLEAEYFIALKKLSETEGNNRLILFLGSNIGNFKPDERLKFMQELYANLKSGDRVLIGFDLKKDPRKILAAYNDKSGYTSDFNLNLLMRINKELGADFDLARFVHYPTYDPFSGRALSFLVSLEAQKVRIPAIDLEVSFEKGEAIHTEMSQKFDSKMIAELAEKAGFKVIGNFTDSANLFVDSLWAK